MTSEWAGTRSQPTKMIPIETSRIDATHFRATFYLDGLLDEDYYGKGVCHWSLIDVSVGFKATEAKEDVDYVFSLDKGAFREGGQDKQYYWKGSYPRMPDAKPGVPDGVWGVRNPAQLRPGFRDNVFFITAEVKVKS